MQPIISVILLLLFDLTVSWIRMFIGLGLSILIGLFIGIYTGRSIMAEKFIMPIVDILQTLPILTFFPFVIAVFVLGLPGAIGVNAAIIFLIVTSMLWNIIFGVYTSIKTLPNEFLEVADLSQMNGFDKLTKVFIPASLPSVAEQSMLSWAIGLFYLVTSEIFSTGSSNYSAKYGIGVALTKLAFSGHVLEYAIGIVMFISAVTLTMIFLFIPIDKRAQRYKDAAAPSQSRWKTIARTFKRAINIRLQFNSNKIKRKPKEQQKSKKDDKRLKVYLAIVVVLLLSIFLIYLYKNNYIDTAVNYEVESIEALAASFLRVWIVFALITLVSVPVSIYLIFITKNAKVYLTIFEIVASIPATILLPIIAISLASVAFHGEIIALVIYFLSGIWYMIFSIMAAARALNIPEILEVKRVFNLKDKDSWKSIYVKAIVPGMLTGAITAIAAEWNASIVAEYFTSTGIGSNGTPVTSVGLGIGKLLDLSLTSSHPNLVLMGVALANMVAMIIIINTFVWKKLYKNVESIR